MMKVNLEMIQTLKMKKIKRRHTNQGRLRPLKRRAVEFSDSESDEEDFESARTKKHKTHKRRSTEEQESEDDQKNKAK